MERPVKFRHNLFKESSCTDAFEIKFSTTSNSHLFFVSTRSTSTKRETAIKDKFLTEKMVKGKSYDTCIQSRL